MFEALKAYMRKMFFVLVGRMTKIVEIPKESSDLGFTSGDGDIHIGFIHEMVLKLPERLRDQFRLGVFTHEMLHQIYTDFGVLEHTLAGIKSRQEASIVSLLSNILEDPTIEYRAPAVVGGPLLRALRFTIRIIYKNSPAIDTSDSGFSQLCNALIQFGDMGLVKGRFTDDEAFYFFREIAPEFNDLVKTSTPKERMEASVRWMDLTRPLWEKEEDPEKTAEKISQDNGITGYSGNTEPQDTGSGSGAEAAETPESKRRDAGAKALQNGTEDEDGQNSAGGSTQKDTEDESNSGVDNMNDPSPSGSYGSVFCDKESADEIVFDELELTDEDIEKVDEELQKLDEANGKETPFIQDLDLEIETRFTGKASCLNHRMLDRSSSAAEKYAELVRKNAKAINELTFTLKTLFNRDQDEMLRAQSGKYNIKRGMLGTSVKVFDKKRAREHIDDVAICMAVDESGSMYSQGKIDVARETAVIFAEVFHRLKIPFYVMGFTADIEKDVLQDHYITWSNTTAERNSLVHMHAQANNFDGYSIRYASKILSQRKAEHKILFVISDGLPACSKYKSLANGLADTADAIRSAKKVAGVFGLGLGDCRPETLKKLYTDTFTHVKNASELPAKAIDLLKKIVKTY